MISCENSTGPAQKNDRTKAPDFTLNSTTLTNANNGELSLSEFEGKVVYLFFLGYACPPCINAAPRTKNIDESYSEEKVQIIGLDVWDGSIGGAANFIIQTDVKYPVCTDASTVANKYGVVQEYSVIVDKDGRIAYKKNGINEQEIKITIDTLLNE